jgi:hypothetical protein
MMPAPYGQQPDPYHAARLLLKLFPEEVRKSASAAALNGRLAEARKLAAQAGDVRLDPLLRSQARTMAAQVLSAPVRRPAAAVAAVAKDGEKTPMQAVFDQDGTLIGVVDPAAIQPVAGAGGRQPGPAEAEQVAKALGKLLVFDQRRRPYAADRRDITRPGERVRGAVAKGKPAKRARPAGPEDVIKSRLGKGWAPVYDFTGRWSGAVRKSRITRARPGGVAKGAPSGAVANVYDSRRRLAGTAPMAAVVSVADLRAAR